MLNNVKKTIKYLYCIFILLNLLMILKNSTSNYIIAYVLLFSLFLLFIAKRKVIIKFINNIPKNIFTILFVIFIVIGISTRISLIFIDYNAPKNDYETFFENAKYFAQNGEIASKNYISIFPYLTSYIVVLGNVFKMIGIRL